MLQTHVKFLGFLSPFCCIPKSKVCHGHNLLPVPLALPQAPREWCPSLAAPCSCLSPGKTTPPSPPDSSPPTPIPGFPRGLRVWMHRGGNNQRTASPCAWNSPALRKSEMPVLPPHSQAPSPQPDNCISCDLGHNFIFLNLSGVISVTRPRFVDHLFYSGSNSRNRDYFGE